LKQATDMVLVEWSWKRSHALYQHPCSYAH